jgi:hypothetical protein
MNNAACIDFYSITRAPDDVLCGFGGGCIIHICMYVFMALRVQKASAATHLQMQSARRANGLYTRAIMQMLLSVLVVTRCGGVVPLVI